MSLMAAAAVNACQHTQLQSKLSAPLPCPAACCLKDQVTGTARACLQLADPCSRGKIATSRTLRPAQKAGRAWMSTWKAREERSSFTLLPRSGPLPCPELLACCPLLARSACSACSACPAAAFKAQIGGRCGGTYIGLAALRQYSTVLRQTGSIKQRAAPVHCELLQQVHTSCLPGRLTCCRLRAAPLPLLDASGASSSELAAANLELLATAPSRPPFFLRGSTTVSRIMAAITRPARARH